MSVHLLLLDALQDLGEESFKTLKFFLSTKVLEGCKPIAKCHLEKAERTDVVTRTLEHYGEDTAVEVCVIVLRKMNQNSCALELETAYTEYKASRPGSGSTPGSSGPPGGPPGGAPPQACISAQTGGLVLAPNVTGMSSGTWNITINQK